MKSKIALAALARSLSSVAWAADAEAYKMADADQDGMISATEAEAVPGLVDQWTVIDANQDGQVDEAEFAQFEAN